MDENFKDKDWLEAADVYSQYFNALYETDGSLRKAVIVKLTVMKDIDGKLGYEISASFMPFEDEEDFSVPDDIRVSRMISYGAKRRMKKNEEAMLASLIEEIDQLLSLTEGNAVIFWDRPLREARRG